MGLNEKDRETVVKLELEKAHRFLAQAQFMTDKEMWEIAVNRYYYACFHVVMALLIKNGLSSKTHSGLVRSFALNFIHKGLIDRSYGAYLTKMMQLRQNADYNCYYDLSQEDIDMCVKQAPLFIEAVERLIK